MVLAALAGALGAAGVLLARERLVLLGGLALLAVAEAALVLGGGSLDSLSSPVALAGGAVGLAGLGAAAAVLVRRPGWTALAVLAAAPFRLPISFDPGGGGLPVAIAQDGQLGRQLPLYFVLGAAIVALAWRALRGERPRTLPRAVAFPAAAFLAVCCLSLLWAKAPAPGEDLLGFFLLPFGALLAVVARSPMPAWLPRRLGQLAVGLAALFALVGLYQAVTQQLFFFAPNVQTANANGDFFRVTSLFVDPSLYGRHVVLGLGVVLAVLALARVSLPVGVALVALLWAGLLFSYSQSSMVALVVVTLALAAATGGPRLRKVAAGAAAAFLVAGLALVIAAALSDDLRRKTSDRSDRVSQTLDVIAEEPVLGVGVGGQPKASREAADSSKPTADFVSHTTPLTVSAELGVAGVLAYLALLFGGARAIAAVHRRDPALGLALGASLLVLFVHSLFYPGFLEDPLTWLVLGLACAHVAQRQATP
ncbi:MAG: O-antigen ligase family protein, partial [Thermoleophilaceae bacterium]|nr:O-antigen ligase family protein [Thermoleophilaceae bacterium]